MTSPGSIAIQRDVIGRMAPFNPETNIKGGHAGDEVLMEDPWTGEPMTYQEFFDQHARLLMVIAEVEARENTPTQGTT